MAVKFLKIATFFAGQKIVKEDGSATTDFLRALNQTFDNVESAVNSIKEQTDDIAFSLQQAGIALTTAEQVEADLAAKARADALKDSYTEPNAILSSDIDPNDAALRTISIMEHTRRYIDGTNVEVSGATLDALPAGKLIFIYYDDAARAGGAVTYRPTTVSTTPVQGLNDERHFVGSITTVADGSTTPTSGAGPTGPGVPPSDGGGGYGNTEELNEY